MKSALSLLLALLALPVAAAPAVIEGVQMPAWVERDGESRPAAVKHELRAGDTLRTGAGARLLVRAADGSAIKLGENARLRLDELADQQRADKRVFRAALNVLVGAFRYTTGVVSAVRAPEVDVRVATITAGIRGTDVWGKSSGESDLVCLIKGRISVAYAGGAPFTMDRPLTFYVVPRGQPPKAVTEVPLEQVLKWGEETEILPGAGAARAGGRWRVTLTEVPTQAEALAAYDRARDAGFAADILPLTDARGTAYRVRLSGLASRADADRVADRARRELGFDARVQR